MNYDLIIIGGGPGGYHTAVEAAKAGLQVALVERGHLGGTCLNEGCIPTKALCRSAEVMNTVRQSADYGINIGDIRPEVNLQTVIERKDKVVQTLRDGVKSLMKTPGLTLIEGSAAFEDAHTLIVSQGDERQTLTATNIFIATGSESRSLPIPGADLPCVMDSTDLLQSTTLPHRLCIIGGGVIGLEFASIFRSFGSEVTVVEYAPEILPRFDKDMAKRLRTSLKRSGITFQVGAAVSEIRMKNDGQAEVLFQRKGKEESVTADRVLMAVGRAARINGLQLENAGIEHSPRGIQVDDDYRTNVNGIYAIGDCNGRCQLAHAATYQGMHALHHLLHRADNIRFDVMPAAVFTVPELATVGLTEEECREQSIDYEVRKTNYLSNGKALAAGAAEGIVKQLYAKDSGRLLGTHILGAHAADLIHEAALQMIAGTTQRGLHEMIHAHPTLSEMLA